MVPAFFCALILVGKPSLAAAGMSAKPVAMNKFIDDLMAKMTVEEKVGQLVQYSGSMDNTGHSAGIDYETEVAAGHVGSIFNVFTPAATRHLQDIALQRTRLKIPLLIGYDVIHGHRTIFPIPLAEAASWNLPLMEKSARLAAMEASADGVHWTFAPMVDISRDPRWGRVMEGAGEDTWLGSRIAAARVRGFQGKDLSSIDSLLSCVKHFAAYGAPMGGRDYNSVDMSDRELYTDYLPPYLAAIRAGAGSLMTSFNEIAGIPSTENEWLLTTLLRKAWGFQGLVVSDYTAVKELVNHGVARDPQQAGLEAFKAGLDMDMESGIYSQYLAGYLDHGQVKAASLNASVRRVLEAKYKLGLFQDPYHGASDERAARELMSPDKLAHARDIARRSIVLLKNAGSLLPLRHAGTIALIGPLADDKVDQIGSWSAAGDGNQAVSLSEGIQNLALSGVRVLHARGAVMPYEKDPPQDLVAEAVEAAKAADVAVLALGESRDMTGEAASRTQIRLPENQQRLLQAVRATGKPIVLVLFNGRPLALEAETAASDAVVEAWFLGTQAGNAIADVLFGNYNPSGKLTMSFPVNEGQIPVFYNEKDTGRPDDGSGDKYQSKYTDAPNDPLFPFGWGLSYTTFSISEPSLSAATLAPGQKLTVTAQVKNTGSVAGEETVQLYIRDLVASVTQPVKQLRGFRKVFLQPGESQRVTMQLGEDDLKFYNQEMKWVAEPGDFKVMLGDSSKDLKEATFTLVGTSGSR